MVTGSIPVRSTYEYSRDGLLSNLLIIRGAAFSRIEKRVDIFGQKSYGASMSEKWEYRVIQNMAIMGGHDKKLVPELNTLGQEGWEAIAVCFKNDSKIEYVLLKRALS